MTLKKQKQDQNHWKIKDLPWDRLDPAKVDADLLKIIKTASLVEYNANDYAAYLCKIFHDDPDFKVTARQWAREEIQHGETLGLWAEKIDPSWHFEKAVSRFRDGYKIEHFAGDTSVRGSRSGELISRCMVETGTSSYYSAIGDATEEPVLKEICRHIAADEFRHYKMFYGMLKTYLEKDGLSRFKRLRITLGRIAEGEDDELAYAYYAANQNEGSPHSHAYSHPYNRKECGNAYLGRAYSYYRPQHLDRAVAMMFKACGFKPHTLPHRIARRMAWWMMESKTHNLHKKAA